MPKKTNSNCSMRALVFKLCIELFKIVSGILNGLSYGTACYIHLVKFNIIIYYDCDLINDRLELQINQHQNEQHNQV